VSRICRLFLLAVIGASPPALAQQALTLRGTVTSAAGLPLDIAQIVVPSLGLGTQTRDDGRYVLTIPVTLATGQTVMVTARALGYKAKTVSVVLQAPLADVSFTLEANPLQLGEVVVTGAGTTREVEKIANARSSVDSGMIEKSGETNVLAAISAKAPGVNVTSNAGDPGASASIRIRGANTIGRPSDPLIVVDGVPVDNSTNTVATLDPQTGGPQGGVASPNRAIDINPDDIASMEILKGAAAGSIYGARAGQGVILITTKSGRSGATITTFRSQYGVSDVNRFPDLQRQYGEGTGGVADPCSSGQLGLDCLTDGFSWGQPLTGATYDHTNEVFQTGGMTDNTLSISGGDAKTTFFASGTYTDQNGPIVGPHDYLHRTSVRLKADHEIAPTLRLNGNVQFANTNQDAVQKGFNFSSITWTSWLTPPNFNNRPYLDPKYGVQRSFRFPLPSPVFADSSKGYDNPFFSAYDNQSSTSTNRLVGSIGTTWQTFPWLTFQYTLGVDYAHDNRIQGEPLGNSQTALPTGQVLSLNLDHWQLDHNLSGTAKWSRGPNVEGTFTLGQNLNARSEQITGIVGDGLFQDFQYSLNNTNAERSPVLNAQAYIHNDGYFSQGTLDLAQQLFLKAGVRYDGSSTFARSNQYAWFPSVSAAWEFTKLFHPRGVSNVLSFGKLRVAYGESGTEPAPYQTVHFYQAASAFNDDFSAANLAEFLNGQSGLFSADTLPGNLKPERTQELEGGGDFGLFGDKSDLSLTYYHKSTNNVILPIVVAASSGATNQWANGASIRNDGIEASLNVRPIQNKLLSWEIGGTYAANWNKVLSLSGLQFIPYGGLGNFGNVSGSGGNAVTLLGGSVDNFFGYDYVRCGNGVALVDAGGNPYSVDTHCSASQKRHHALFIADANLAANNSTEGAGYPILDPSQRGIGNPDARWTGNIHSTVRIKHFTVSALVDIREGGSVYNATLQTLDYYGASAEAGQLRNKNVVFGSSFMSGPIAGPGAGTPAVLDQTFFQNYRGAILPSPYATAPFIVDGSFVRLREISVGYTFQGRFLSHNLGLGSIDLRVAGRNLAIWTKYKGADPEVSAGGAESGVQGIDYFGTPQTRTFLFTLTITR
jgi:TonB-linked SusC/RagA family outer membrane protein